MNLITPIMTMTMAMTMIKMMMTMILVLKIHSSGERGGEGEARTTDREGFSLYFESKGDNDDDDYDDDDSDDDYDDNIKYGVEDDSKDCSLYFNSIENMMIIIVPF